MPEPLLFEISSEGRIGHSLSLLDITEIDISDLIPEKFQRTNPPELPEMSEQDVVRHYHHLSVMNHHVDKGFYPLGSCTMKYNPKINETLAGLSGFANIHPFQKENEISGNLQLMGELAGYLCEIGGMDAMTLQPAAGAHGEMTGLKIMRAYHENRGNPRKKVVLPDSAHGTNPASATITGYEAVQIKSTPAGLVDIEDLKSNLSDEVAGVMLTNPNTLGLFESRIVEIARLVHNVGALLYMDGANLNALLGIVRPGDIGFDIVHFNLHKTFSTPHGGGGPGSGPIGVKGNLSRFLPVPVIVKNEDRYSFDYERPESIGKVQGFYGNFGILVRAYIYIRMLGARGLKKASENAILNANYLMHKLMPYYELPHKQHHMHEFVLSGDRQKEKGIKTLDIAKRILDYGFHAPTVYFPLIVHEAMMIEPTETESKETLDAFAEAMISIAREAETDPALLRNAPSTTPVFRLDEAAAARNLNVAYKKVHE
jgi:glycine dehydrogenase subunit 2